MCRAEGFNSNRNLLNQVKPQAIRSKQVRNDVNDEKIQSTNKIIKAQNINKKKNDLDEMQKRKLFDKIILYENRLKAIVIMKKLKENEMKERGLYRNLEILKKKAYVLEITKSCREKFKKRIFDKILAPNKR
ncbi:hypothetical protein ACKWTF_007555 [Chironomus riparius]